MIREISVFENNRCDANKTNIKFICSLLMIAAFMILCFHSYHFSKRKIDTLSLIPHSDSLLSDNNIDASRSLPRKVFHFLKEAGLGIGNMQPPTIWDDIDNQRNLLILDVGACDGADWSIPAVIKRGHTVLAFEPVNANRFRNQVQANGLQDKMTEIHVQPNKIPEFPTTLQNRHTVTPTYPLVNEGHIYFFEACVSNSTSEVIMFSKDEMASIVPQDFYPDAGFANNKRLHIPSLMLDSVVAQDVHLLKIDTQGHEYGVLLGARKLFENFRVNMVELEFWPRGMARGGVNAVQVLDFLHSHGFMCFDYSRNMLIPANRPSDFEGFVRHFELSDDEFGPWDELLCYNVS